MFAIDRSAFAVLAPLVLLVAVVWWSNRTDPQPSAEQAQAQQQERPSETLQTVAANLPSR